MFQNFPTKCEIWITFFLPKSLEVRIIILTFVPEFSLLHHLNFNHYGKRHQKDKERKDDGKG